MTPLPGELIQFAKAKAEWIHAIMTEKQKGEWIWVIFTESLAFVFRNIRVLPGAEGMYWAHYGGKPLGTSAFLKMILV